MKTKQVILIASAVATGILAACGVLSEIKEEKKDEQ
jgi:hypothetical protein